MNGWIYLGSTVCQELYLNLTKILESHQIGSVISLLPVIKTEKQETERKVVWISELTKNFGFELGESVPCSYPQPMHLWTYCVL